MSTSEKRDVHLRTLLSAKIWVPVAFFLVDTFPENRALAGRFFPSFAWFSVFAFSAPK